MVVQKNLLVKLKDFGLNSYESKLWSALLSRGISTAGELSDIANVPRSRSYDVLESLEKKGFIIMKLGKPIKYIAVKPTEVLDRVKSKISEDATKTISILSELDNSETLKELTLLYNNGVEFVEPSDITGSIRGRDRINTQINSMINSAKESIQISSLLNKSTIKNALKLANKNGVKVKIISETKDEDLKNISKSLKTDSKYLIVDDKEVLFLITDDKQTHATYETAVWLRAPFFVKTLNKHFTNEWKLAN